METVNENKKRTPEDDSQYFGAYLNLARLNIYAINNHLAKEFKRAGLEEDGYIKNSFICNDNIKHLNYNYLFEKLVRLMPVVKQFDAARLPEKEREKAEAEGKSLVEMAKTLRAVFDDIQQFRNDYTHYYSVEWGDIRKVVISEETAGFLKKSFERAVEYTKVRFAGVLDESDFKAVEKKSLVTKSNTGKNRITTEGLVFLTSMFLDRENAFLFIGKVKGLKDTRYKPFIAMREALMAYCVKLPHDKLISDDPKKALFLDMLNELNRCPKQLYNVLDEDAKKEFRPALSDESLKNVFENSVDEEALDELGYQKYIELLTMRVRHDNRFYYHTMRFIDEQNLLPDFYFQIDLGKYILADYQKTILGEETPRIIMENAKAFGRLGSFTSPDEVGKQIDSNGLGKGFEQFAPHYNADFNKIGIAFKRDLPIVLKKEGSHIPCNLKQPHPEAFLSLHELSKIVLLECLEKGESLQLIKEHLGTADDKLFNIEFIEQIKSELPEWEVFRKQCDTKKAKAYSSRKTPSYPKERKEKLDEVLKPHGLNRKRIPERILNYWLNIEDVGAERSITERILLMKRDGLKRLKQLEKHRSNPEVGIPKVGEMATFIARDIVGMIIDKERKNKITPIYYDMMQGCLAYYADREKKRRFIGLVKELKLNESDGHPFLKNLDFEKIHKTSEFYKLYLEEKVYKQEKFFNYRKNKEQTKEVSWVTKTFEKKKRNEKAERLDTTFELPEDKSSLPYSIRQWEEKEEYDLRAWLRNIKKGRQSGDRKRPIDLPTDLFDERLRKLLSERLEEQGQTVKEGAKYKELFKCWWETKRGDNVQSFYNGTRCYTIKGEQVSFEPDSESSFVSYYRTPLNKAYKRLHAQREEEREKNKKLPSLREPDMEKVFKRTLSETERDIRMLAYQDCVLLLMAEQLGSGEETEHLKLSGINKELNKISDVKREFSYTPYYDELGKVPPKGAELPAVRLTVTAKMKLKNIKDLNRFAYDRRIPELVAYLPGAAIDADSLRHELTDYNKARQTVFDTVFRLEKEIVKKDHEGLIKLNVDDKGPLPGNIQHRPYMQWLINEEIISEDERFRLNMIRNCFSHNQFPHEVAIRNKDSMALPGIASKIAEQYEQRIAEIIEEINKKGGHNPDC